MYKWSQKLLVDQNDEPDHCQNYQRPEVAENRTTDESWNPAEHEANQKSPRSEGINPDRDKRKHSHDPNSDHVL